MCSNALESDYRSSYLIMYCFESNWQYKHGKRQAGQKPKKEDAWSRSPA
jgi:hypothetical protein